jgi:hypothetical protein
MLDIDPDTSRRHQAALRTGHAPNAGRCRPRTRLLRRTSDLVEEVIGRNAAGFVANAVDPLEHRGFWDQFYSICNRNELTLEETALLTKWVERSGKIARLREVIANPQRRAQYLADALRQEQTSQGLVPPDRLATNHGPCNESGAIETEADSVWQRE